eukprot:CAMPEP_0194253944 /NCGR_PEP_ID=MMETSP0158-20130606/30981_1 /TAXON_ID=33649 /ORGANISM="Thalassionema nitzschioides, Strain L26-B" /LENGTH=48 /DNA_ID= /DNA_START= /DNA_END= /DNA_ORIENTATION=
MRVPVGCATSSIKVEMAVGTGVTVGDGVNDGDSVGGTGSAGRFVQRYL